MAESLVGPVGRVAAGHPQRPRDVRAVAADRAADVEHDRLAGADDPVGCLVVRRRRVRARSRRSRNAPRRGPRRSSRSRTSRATSASVRPTSRPAAIWATTRSAAWAACGQQRDLVGVLDHPQLAQDRRGELERRVRETSPGAAAGARAGEVVRDRDPESAATAPARTIAGHERVGVLGLLPGHDREVAGGGRRAGRGGRRLEPRDDQDGLAVGRDDQHRQPLERHRRVAGQVAQVRPDADEQRVEARPRRPPAGARPAARRSARPGSSAGAVMRASPAGRRHRRSPASAAIVAGPSSNSLRYAMDAVGARRRGRGWRSVGVVVLADGQDRAAPASCAAAIAATPS